MDKINGSIGFHGEINLNDFAVAGICMS